MIHHAFILLRNELEAYFSAINDPVDIIAENIGLLETQHADNLNNSIVLSLVNIEEEATLKNNASFLVSGGERTARYTNPPVHLNLYILFTANFPGGAQPNNGYLMALAKLAHVIRFFQGRSHFSVSALTQPLPGSEDPLVDPALLGLRFTMELYTMTFEQINHLWGSLGGRQVPFAMYKMRLVVIDDRRLVREVPLVEEIDSRLTKFREAKQ